MNTPSATVRPTRRAAPPANPAPRLCISERTIKGLTDVFDLLADESRLKILLALSQHGEMHVSALCDLLGRQVSQPAVSHHLKQLRQSHLIDRRRVGKHNYYRLDSALVRDLFAQFLNDTGTGLKPLRLEDFSLAFRRK